MLKPLVEELSATSPIAPALVSGVRMPRITASDSSTETLLRQGTSSGDLWLIAARSGRGTATVTFDPVALDLPEG